MAESKKCNQCGAELPRDAPDGHCAKCLLQLGLASKLQTNRPVSREKHGASAPAQSPEKPGERIGPYKVLQQIGEGGCGVVYMAEQEVPVRRRVALKVIKPGMDTRQVVARFEAERQALALMEHPNIARVFDGGTTESGRLYFVMELVCGIKITDFCDQNQFSTRQRLDLFLLVCQAIQHAHQKGVIHRDIKPSNVLVTELDGEPVPKVIDFGIAKATGQERLTDKTLFTAFNHFMGTPAYMSPEQAGMGKLDVDTRSDIYSLGVLLYELLTGNAPFSASELNNSGMDEICRIIKEKEPPRPSTRVTKLAQLQLTEVARARRIEPAKLPGLLRRDLDWIVMRCLEKDRKRRYETVTGLAMDVKRYLANEPIVARPATAFYRFQKDLKRNKLAYAATAAVLASLVVGLGIAIWMYARERQAHKMAVAAEHEQRELREAAETAQAEEAQQRRRAEAEAYAANMNLAQQAWEHADVMKVRQLLEATASNPSRGFEWYYWQRQIHLNLQTFHGHTAAINSVAFFRDGQRIVTASNDRTTKVWEASTGKELFTLKGHGDFVMCVAVSPDGQRIVTGSQDRKAIVWDAASGKELLTFNGHRTSVYSVAISPDGRRVATGTYDGTTVIWDMASGKELLRIEGHAGSIWSVAFSPDGQKLLTANMDGTAKQWDAATGEELTSFKGRLKQLTSVGDLPDGRWIAGAGNHGTEVWEATTGKELLFFNEQQAWVTSVAFSPDSQRIMTSCNEGTAKFWDLSSGRELFTIRGHLGGVNCAAISPDGQRAVTGSDDGTAMLWDATREPRPLVLKGYTERVNAVAFPRTADESLSQVLMTRQGYTRRTTGRNCSV